jgi:hypothetical protein
MGLINHINFDIGSQVLVYNSENTSFVGTVGMCATGLVTFNEISHLTVGPTGRSSWTLQQYGCA